MLDRIIQPPRTVARLVHLLGAAGLVCGAALTGSAHAGSSAEWLASTDGPSPTVTTKSGVGTAQASATAKVTSESIRQFCSDQGGQGSSAQARAGVDACVQQQKPELGKTYTVQADCTSGRLQPLDGNTYVLDGLWDNSDVGGGRTRWKGPNGVVGRDNASGGLALSQQWEVLCPGRVSASVISKARSLSPSGSGTGGTGGAASAAAAPASVCGGDPNCTEVSAFAASVVEFRATLQGNWKVLTTTLRFQNKLNRPLVLGYLLGSGGATDDRGNRYIVKDQDTRGIGNIAHANAIDDKFVLAPGQTGDARFTLVWGGQALFGSTFDLDLTVREIVPAGNGQKTLGPEYPLQIVGLVDGAKASGAGGAVASAAPAASGQQPSQDTQTTAASAPQAPSSAPAAGGMPSPFGAPATAGGGAHCAQGTSCSDAGSFSVTLGQTATAVSGKNQLVRLNVRIKNNTNQPLALGYKTGSASAVDEQGSTFIWGRPGTNDASAQGIGVVDGTRIDPRFQVAPGGTRDAQFVLTRFDAGPKPPGKSFTLNTVLVELRANGAQWQKVREVPVRLPAAGSIVPAVGQGQTPANDSVQKASDLLKGLLGGK